MANDYYLTSENESKKFIKIPKWIFIVSLVCLVLLVVALIIGLTLGLKKAYAPSETQKYETCVDISCNNLTILQGY